MESINLNKFSVSILNEYNDKMDAMNISGGNYVPLPHNTEYKIMLKSSRNVRTDATVYVDGEKIGIFRINPHDSITIERTSNVRRKLTYVDEKSLEAVDYGLDIGSKDNGLIRVIFRPEPTPVVNQTTLFNSFPYSFDNSQKSLNNSLNYETRSGRNVNSNTQTYSSGGTLLGKKSNQEFNDTYKLNYYDRKNITEISLRLITDNTKEDFEDFVPIKQNKTDYPRRLEDTRTKFKIPNDHEYKIFERNRDIEDLGRFTFDYYNNNKMFKRQNGFNNNDDDSDGGYYY